MKKFVLIIALALTGMSLTAGDNKIPKELPKDHLLTIENETGHKLFIMEEKSFKKLNPQEAVVLYWKEPLPKHRERTIRIYYGGNIKEDIPSLRKRARPTRLSKEKQKISLGTEPAIIAQLRTNKPGTISISYDQNGLLKMERI